MSAKSLRTVYLVLAVVLLFFVFLTCDRGGHRDFVQASFVIGYCIAGSVALVLSAIVKNNR
jgi:hypothetical protein